MEPVPSVRATIYLRLSLDRHGDELGVERQEADCRALCAAKDWAVREVLTDNDLSATTGKHRPGFEQLLVSSPEAVVVWHLDRLIRLTKDLERVIALGVNVHAVTAGHVDLSTPAGRAVARTITAWSTYEGEQRTLRQKAAHLQRAELGKPWWSWRPFGFERDGAHRDDEAAFVRSAYGDLLAGSSLYAIARRWNEAGYQTARGNDWRQTSVRTLLLAPRNCGLIERNKELVGKGGWEGLVDEDIWRAAVRLLRDPARSSHHTGARQSLLSGLLVCEVCGAPCHQAPGGGGRSFRSYRCRGGAGGGVGHVTQRMEWVDRVVTEQFLTRLERSGSEAVMATDATVVDEARANVLALRERLAALVEDYAEGLVTRQQLTSGSVRLRERLAGAEATLTRVSPSAALSGLLAAPDVRSAWAELDTDRRRAVLELSIEKVVLRQRGRGVRAQRVEDMEMIWRGTQEAPQPEG
jgi:DNA invertase Pin-like site-specific DNA recombinase